VNISDLPKANRAPGQVLTVSTFEYLSFLRRLALDAHQTLGCGLGKFPWFHRVTSPHAPWIKIKPFSIVQHFIFGAWASQSVWIQRDSQLCNFGPTPKGPLRPPAFTIDSPLLICSRVKILALCHALFSEQVTAADNKHYTTNLARLQSRIYSAGDRVITFFVPREQSVLLNKLSRSDAHRVKI